MPSKFHTKFKVTGSDSGRFSPKPLAEQTGRFEMNSLTMELPSSASTPRQSDQRPGNSLGKRMFTISDQQAKTTHDLPQSLMNPMFEEMENQTHPKMRAFARDQATYRNFKHLDDISLRENSEFCEPVLDDGEHSLTTDNGPHSFLGTRTFGISTLELVDLGLATGGFDSRSPTPYTLTTLPNSPCPSAIVKKNSSWQSFIIMTCLFLDVETLIGTPLKMFHHGQLAFLTIYIGTLLTIVFPLAFTHCLIGQSQSSGQWMTTLTISPLGQGLVHATLLVLIIMGNQKMIHCVRSFQTVILSISQGSTSDHCNQCDHGWIWTNPNASSACPISNQTTNHTGIEPRSCFNDHLDPFDTNWSEQVHGNPIIASGSFAFTLLLVWCFMYLGFSSFRRALPLVLSTIVTLLLIVFIRVGSNMNRSDFSLVFDISWQYFGMANTWILACQCGITTGVFLSGLLYFTSSFNPRNHAFPRQLMGCIGLHTLGMLLSYIIVGGVLSNHGRDQSPVGIPHLMKFLYFDLPEYFFQFEIPQVWRVCYGLFLFLIELMSLIILGMCLSSVWQTRASHIPVISMPWVRTGLICSSLVVLCIPEMIVPSIGLSQGIQLVMEKYVQETLALLQIWLAGSYGLVKLVSIQKLLLGYSFNKIVALVSILFIASVMLSLMIYDMSGFATPRNLRLVNPWITSGGGLIAILIVLVSAYPCILAMAKAKIQGRPVRDVFTPLSPLNKNSDCHNSTRTQPRVLLQKSEDHFRS